MRLIHYVKYWAISGVVFLMLEQENKFVRFHAAALAFILWVVLMFKAFQCNKYKLP